MGKPPHWMRRKRPSAKTRGAVLWALRGEAAMTPHELASEANLPWCRVCAALNELMIRGQVEREDGRYRRVSA